MTYEAIEAAFRAADVRAHDAILDLPSVVWVDWRAAEDEIVDDFARVLDDGTLRAEPAGDHDEVLRIHRDGAAHDVALTRSPEDRQRALLGLQAVLGPERLIRFATRSAGGDTLAFVVLTWAQWHDLDRRFGDAVARHYQPLADTTDLFVDAAPPPSATLPRAARPPAPTPPPTANRRGFWPFRKRT